MLRRNQAAKHITARVFLLVCVTLLAVSGVFARNGRVLLIEGLIQRMDRQSRRIILWEYRSGDSTWDLRVPGTISLRRFEVGDLVRVTTDHRRRDVHRIRKLEPREGDERYQKAIQRLEAETAKPGN
ncbi:MAG: hypothetical protein ACE5G5_00990 [Candidatus Methylomirabilales bacterium]